MTSCTRIALPSVRVFAVNIAIHSSEAASRSRRRRGVGMWRWYFPSPMLGQTCCVSVRASYKRFKSSRAVSRCRVETRLTSALSVRPRFARKMTTCWARRWSSNTTETKDLGTMGLEMKAGRRKRFCRVKAEAPEMHSCGGLPPGVVWQMSDARGVVERPPLPQVTLRLRTLRLLLRLHMESRALAPSLTGSTTVCCPRVASDMGGMRGASVRHDRVTNTHDGLGGAGGIKSKAQTAHELVRNQNQARQLISHTADQAPSVSCNCKTCSQ